MPFGNQRRRPSIDPHGYHPIEVDEHCLDNQDCREAVLDAFERPCDWTKYLTGVELKKFQADLDTIDNVKSPFESLRRRDKQAEMSRLGLFRAFARQKYAGGHRYWYGDGEPFNGSAEAPPDR